MSFAPDPNSILSKEYQKIHHRIDNNEYPADANFWTVTDSLIYLCIRYKEKFQRDFVFTYKETPSKSFEYKSMSRVWMMTKTKSGNGQAIKEYLDWFFENYSGKRPFVSITALAKIEVVSKYFEQKKNASKPTTATNLPDDVKSFLAKYKETSYISTFGDLVFMYKALSDNGGLNEEPHKTIFDILFSQYSSVVSKDILQEI